MFKAALVFVGVGFYSARWPARNLREEQSPSPTDFKAFSPEKVDLPQGKDG